MITVFGSINMDLIARVERLPRPGETVAGRSFATAAGGKGANQALAARRAGSSVRMAGAVGTDGFAGDALALLDAAGTDLSSVIRADVGTGTAHILVDDAGENVIAVVPGANGAVSPEAAAQAVAAMAPDDLLMLQFELPVDATERALVEARDRGIRTVLNTAPLIAEAGRLAALAGIVIANETEFDLLAAASGIEGGDREERMERLHRQGGQTLIVTLGADGIVALHDGKFVRAQALAISPVDTVGAGDTFCGYFTAALDQGLAFDAALKRAAIAGSLACLKPGAQPSIPGVDELTAYL